jgi:type I restriction enzyme M protein
VRHHPADGKLGEFVTDAFRDAVKLNPDLDGTLNVKDYNERQSGQRILDDDRLAELFRALLEELMTGRVSVARMEQTAS